VETRVCSKCSLPKPIEEFTREKKGTNGRGRYCKPCRSSYNKNYSSKRLLYGVPANELKERKEGQGGCAICKQNKFLYADYDQETKTLRGFLCIPCLGRVKALKKLRRDEVELDSIVRYLNSEPTFTTESPDYTVLGNFAKKHETYYRKKLKEQNGVCAICKKPSEEYHRHTPLSYRQLSLDHNHQTGQLRGLLCGQCNRGLGLFYESVNTIKNAITYLGT